jgi:hypothetical protein
MRGLAQEYSLLHVAPPITTMATRSRDEAAAAAG